MIVGDFISEEIGELFIKEHRIMLQYIKYCKEHNKKLETRYCVLTGPLFLLQIIILDNNDNNGQIKDC